MAIIIGGGIVAQACAIALAARNPQMITAAAAPPQSRLYAVSAAARAFLRELGITPPALPVKCFNLHTRARAVTLRQESPLCYMMTEQALTEAAAARCRQLRIPVIAAADIAAPQADADAVTVRADGQTLRGDFAVIADGARSRMARQMGVGGYLRDFAAKATVATVRAPELAADAASQWFLGADIIALLPRGDGRFSLVWSGNCPPAAPQIAAALRRKLRLPRLTVSDEDAVQQFPLYANRRAVRAAPRVVFVGDAAQLFHPMAGQGLNQGVDDIRVLVRCLRGNRGSPLALAAYAAARAPRAAALHRLTALLHRGDAVSDCIIHTAQIPLIQKLSARFANGA